MAELSLSVQYGVRGAELPSRYRVRRLVQAALPSGGEVTVRFVSASEMQSVGQQHHHRKVADILSFAYHSPLASKQAAPITSTKKLTKTLTKKSARTDSLESPDSPCSPCTESPSKSHAPIVGDIVVCAEIAAKTATARQRCLSAHLSHLIVHGALHLAGYTHQNDTDADKMENAERRILAQFGIADPYQ